MTDIRDVLKEMRETASDLSESACEDCMNGCVTWADTIEAAVREPIAEIFVIKALDEWNLVWRVNRDKVSSGTKLFTFPPDAAGEIERLREICDDLYSDKERLREALHLMLEIAPRGVLNAKEGVALKAAYAALNRETVVNQQLTTDWQPIETAPKDRVIFVFRKHGTFPIHALYNPQYEWLESYADGEHLYDLTHWMEVPKAPEAHE